MMNQRPDDDRNGFDMKNILKIGTSECAVFLALVAMLAAILILLTGFWSTVLIAVCVALGAFIGGVKDKKKAVSDFVNRVFPARDASVGKPGDETLEKIVREKMKEKDASDDR